MIDIIPNWHPIFVHFTVALLTVAAALHLISHFVSDAERVNQLTLVARWNLWLGVGMTVLTVGAGWYAYNTVNHDTPSHAAMTEHRNWALATTAAFLAVVAVELWLQRHKQGRSWLFTGLLVVAAGLLVSTAWHGGELVYRYGLGVMSMPKGHGEGHAHDHGAHDSGGAATDGNAPTHHGSLDEMPAAGAREGGHGDGHEH